MPAPIRIEIYSRPHCPLCDEAKDVVEEVAKNYPFSLTEINIEEDPKLEAAYGAEIPVVFINGKKAFKYRVNKDDLERKVKRLWNT